MTKDSLMRRCLYRPRLCARWTEAMRAARERGLRAPGDRDQRSFVHRQLRGREPNPLLPPVITTLLPSYFPISDVLPFVESPGCALGPIQVGGGAASFEATAVRRRRCPRHRGGPAGARCAARAVGQARPVAGSAVAARSSRPPCAWTVPRVIRNLRRRRTRICLAWSAETSTPRSDHVYPPSDTSAASSSRPSCRSRSIRRSWSTSNDGPRPSEPHRRRDHARSPARCRSSTCTSSGSRCWIVFGVEDYPFGLLTMIVSLEAIFLSTFVMISQNRADAKRQVIADQQWQTVQEEDQQNKELLDLSIRSSSSPARCTPTRRRRDTLLRLRLHRGPTPLQGAEPRRDSPRTRRRLRDGAPIRGPN